MRRRIRIWQDQGLEDICDWGGVDTMSKTGVLDNDSLWTEYQLASDRCQDLSRAIVAALRYEPLTEDELSLARANDRLSCRGNW